MSPTWVPSTIVDLNLGNSQPRTSGLQEASLKSMDYSIRAGGCLILPCSEGLNKIAFVCTGMHFFALTVLIDSCGTVNGSSGWLRRPRSILLRSSWRPWRLVRPSVFLSGRSPRGSPPPLSLRTGLVSHFLRVLTEWREAGELGAELLEA